eukprot:scaffold7879_cov103-Isochrysis_galbana.AAC.2
MGREGGGDRFLQDIAHEHHSPPYGATQSLDQHGAGGPTAAAESGPGALFEDPPCGLTMLSALGLSKRGPTHAQVARATMPLSAGATLIFDPLERGSALSAIGSISPPLVASRVRVGCQPLPPSGAAALPILPAAPQ